MYEMGFFKWRAGLPNFHSTFGPPSFSISACRGESTQPPRRVGRLERTPQRHTSATGRREHQKRQAPGTSRKRKKRSAHPDRKQSGSRSKKSQTSKKWSGWRVRERVCSGCARAAVSSLPSSDGASISTAPSSFPTDSKTQRTKGNPRVRKAGVVSFLYRARLHIKARGGARRERGRECALSVAWEVPHAGHERIGFENRPASAMKKGEEEEKEAAEKGEDENRERVRMEEARERSARRRKTGCHAQNGIAKELRTRGSLPFFPHLRDAVVCCRCF